MKQHLSRTLALVFAAALLALPRTVNAQSNSEEEVKRAHKQLIDSENRQ